MPKNIPQRSAPRQSARTPTSSSTKLTDRTVTVQDHIMAITAKTPAKIKHVPVARLSDDYTTGKPTSVPLIEDARGPWTTPSKGGKKGR